VNVTSPCITVIIHVVYRDDWHRRNSYTLACGFFLEKSHARPRSDIRTCPFSSSRIFAGWKSQHGASLNPTLGLHWARKTRKNNTNTHTHTHTRLTALFPGWAGTRKAKPIWILLKQETSEWQWHQLGHMQVCTQLQTDNHASTPPLSFFTGRMPFLPPNQ